MLLVMCILFLLTALTSVYGKFWACFALFHETHTLIVCYCKIKSDGRSSYTSSAFAVLKSDGRSSYTSSAFAVLKSDGKSSYTSSAFAVLT